MAYAIIKSGAVVAVGSQALLSKALIDAGGPNISLPETISGPLSLPDGHSMVPLVVVDNQGPANSVFDGTYSNVLAGGVVEQRKNYRALEVAEVKAEKLAALDADRRRIETLPIAGNQGGKTFNISRPEKINEFLMGGLSIALDPSPQASFTMLDDNGVEVTYSKVLMGQIIAFINSSKQPALKRYDARKKAIEDAQDAADLARVDTDLAKP